MTSSCKKGNIATIVRLKETSYHSFRWLIKTSASLNLNKIERRKANASRTRIYIFYHQMPSIPLLLSLPETLYMQRTIEARSYVGTLVEMVMHYYPKTCVCIDNPAYHALHEFDCTTWDVYVPRLTATRHIHMNTHDINIFSLSLSCPYPCLCI